MRIRNSVSKTIISKSRVGDTEQFVYGATDRFGQALTFVSNEDLAIGARMTVPNKPDEPMTVKELWSRSSKTLPPLASAGAIMLTPDAAQALEGSELAKALLKQVGIPEVFGSTPQATGAGTVLRDAAQHPLFRHLAMFAAVFVGVLGIQSVWWPERPWHVALITASALAASAWAVYALVSYLS